MTVTIKTIPFQGKLAYFLYVGEFAHEANALQLKFKLSSINLDVTDTATPSSLMSNLLKSNIDVEPSADKSSYFLKVGPINDYLTATNLQKTLTAKLILQSELPITTPSTKIEYKPGLEIEATKKLWNLRNADIRAVIDEVSMVTGKNFVIDPRVQGQVSIVSSTALSDKELYPVFLSVLQVAGFAAIPSGDIIKIIPNLEAHTQFADTLSQLRSPRQGDDMMVEVISVHYVPAEQLVPLLRPLMPQWSTISAYGPSNSLILSGRANNIRQIASIIKQVDNSSGNGIEMVTLKYALAMDVVSTLKDLVRAQPSSGSTIPTTIAADDRSNTILLSGNKTDRIRLRILIAKLDKQNQYGNNSNTQVVYLNYLRAEDLVPILAGIAQANFSGNVGTTIGTITRPKLDSTNPNSSLISGDDSTQPTESVPTSTAALKTIGAITQNEGSTKPSVQIIAEPNTNSIIINAPASIIHILKIVIAQLDIRPAQLLIEALVAEVDESDLVSLGIEWGSSQRNSNPRDFRPGFAIINSKTSIQDFQAQIYALARRRKANILSTPSVVVLDNRQAKILVGKQVSVASTTYPNNASGTTTASPYVTFNRVNVALHLYVRPQITKGQGIQLQIDQGNDTLDPTSISNTENPTFKISSIVTSVQVESGDIVVLGGLTQDSLGNTDTKIPILGDIPILGRLFQNNNRAREKRVLMVFIRPIIIKNQQDSIQVTGSKYDDVRQYQLEWLGPIGCSPQSQASILPTFNKARSSITMGNAATNSCVNNKLLADGK